MTMPLDKTWLGIELVGKSGVYKLPGLRAFASINSPGGYAAYSDLGLRVYGMTMQMMDYFSSVGTDMAATLDQSVRLYAGYESGPKKMVFEGTIIRAYPDMAGLPEPFFSISAVAGGYARSIPAAPGRWPRSWSAEGIIKSIATAAGLKFLNDGGAHKTLVNQVASGSAIEQIATICKAAGFPYLLENDTVVIWPNEGYRDSSVIDLSEKTGMVGFPQYGPAWFVVKSKFNPEIKNGRQIKVASSLPKSNGVWGSHAVLHELSSQAPGGPWFTTVTLAPPGYVPAN